MTRSTVHTPTKIKALIADWDDTITTKDTIELVAEAAYITNPDFPVKWSHFTSLYYSHYKAFIEQFGPRNDLTSERKFQEGLKQIELSSVEDFVERKLFQNVTHDTFQSQACKVGIKEHFFEVFKQLYDLQIPVIILSCNWTSVIMENIFKNHGFEQNDHFQIITNEFVHVNGNLTGEVSHDKCIRTGVDKVKHLTDIKLKLKKEHNVSDGIYYIGDSCTDVLPMLETNYGVIIGNGSAKATMERLRVPVDQGIFGDGNVKWIQDWKELEPLIKG
ncbi:hypothetical protein WICPIJ_005565 [Wickerhamomyces pijperi]|uniref:Uncharacterized protein n=1 Tax=Wickerhamomyces pijperi TaxID=599730 RepID=A0A9P8TM95_WICPI|nr:hypothetical protein WICPIJ_005565 [Wickerhamomyces pijperi]